MITVAVARERLGVDSSEDRNLAQLIDRATAFLGHTLNRFLGPLETTTEVLCGGPTGGPGRESLVLADDVADPAGLRVYTRWRWTDPWSAAVDSSLYLLEGRVLSHAECWPWGRGTVKVVYSRGFAVGAGPAELQDLVLQLVQLRWSQRGGQEGLADGMRSETLGDYSYTRGDVESLAAWEAVTSKWRRRVA